ncbi:MULTISPECIES: NAD-dependent epimerase/dehydratase family protein [unclassified Streptomyces]|uniref:NAD-dependent epimerase/dehydratase family protein n=1 Tax=unclassified Streptomyces TaxID=2593676 RepID=UPI000823E8DC|nr:MULTISPECIES: NAD-dependent epimerase/dehydratase family protein [unclassified Streptomyces]MYU00569.1 NAD-dependent epimerase/dehydratase family protein [Streptomyces sp. SID8350]SCK08356.1 Nucleoside-diphosphate-sugar epimerase [Streptomyces sp. AmelKG-D3]
MTHPRRISAAGEIAAKDPRGRIQVVQDPDPSGPPTALRTANPSWSCVGDAATHHIVFQDDVILARGFFDHVEKAAAAVPGEAVAFYEGWEGRNSGVVRLGALTGASWAYAVDEHVPSLALMLPAEAARGYARFAAEHGDGWPYDVVIQRYLKALGIPVRIAVPSTVDHDDVPSLAGNSKHGWRRATYFTDAAADVVSPDCASFPVVPFYQYGESKCAVRQDGRWEYLDTDRYLRRLGLAERCDADFAGAGEPDLPAEVRRQVWLTAFATGVAVAGATGREPDPEAAAAVMDSLGPGGLCEEYTGAELLPMIPRIRALALAALAAGRTAHGTGARPDAPAATVVVTGGAPTLGAELARLLTDAGRPAAYSEQLGGGRGQEVHTVVHLGDPSGSAYAVEDLLAEAEKAGTRRLVHVGSAEVYRGSAADECAEDTVTEPPRDPVARAWWNDEQACLRWGGETGVPVQLVRLAEQVGRHAPVRGVLATWMLQAWTRRSMTLVEGRVHQLVDHRDTAEAIAAVLAAPVRSTVYNVASARFDEERLAELAAETARLTAWERTSGEDTAHTPPMSTELITAETGWRASAPLRNGARAQAQWLACDTHDELSDLLQQDTDG